MGYRNEATFSKALCTKLAFHNIFHQRIESGDTGRGIPDLYVRTVNTELWLELKNQRSDSVHEKEWHIRWRPGQQTWAARYRKATCGKRFTYTVVAMADGFILIPMCKHYKGNMVKKYEVTRMTKLIDLVGLITNDV